MRAARSEAIPPATIVTVTIGEIGGKMKLAICWTVTLARQIKTERCRWNAHVWVDVVFLVVDIMFPPFPLK
ncbi:hypothetical protein SERLADRAFT_394536 [Serpula lacrymans var. lacrymans S7.9]|uniref:Uncharacterized protein n=1 Tax=Serpula lacrymans var. lacrymans (strain S7.9) TaxID=578457 RepID=F8P2B7_SERL9|nr:uncharacterized protein SERLADRAFT_394536 [Serpula lacrymans var. lacrymans S7.9]EGO23295.1 hypothetical protein SERLADRAFT_394536 [Serpula lacrymans var. lacrymans S7.9]